MSKYILNHYYILRHDTKRTYLLSSRYVANASVTIEANWQSRIHPAYAMMLSFFSDPVELGQVCHEIAEFFSFSEEKVLSFIQNLINANEVTHTEIGGGVSTFPAGLLIEESKEFATRQKYSPEDFKFEELDIKSERAFNAPVSILWIPNNNCMTDCIYCYADTKTRKGNMTIPEIKRFLRDAREERIREILISGGDFFINPIWEDILQLLEAEDYKPDLISTKVPLSLDMIQRFEQHHINLQISIDSVEPEKICNILKVSTKYIIELQDTIINIDKSGITYQLSTVLTNQNDTIYELEKLSQFIVTLHRPVHWEIRVGFRSLNSKANFEEIRSTRRNIVMVEKWVNEKKKDFPIKILWSPDEDKTYKKTKGGSAYFDGPHCSANKTHMVVLPDGAVTICEQLYWNAKFIIGNVKKNSIAEIWNSDKAINLWEQKQDSIKQSSPCRNCSDFASCFAAGNRCYANIMKAYGTENYDYPDPRCCLAPDFNRMITHE